MLLPLFSFGKTKWCFPVFVLSLAEKPCGKIMSCLEPKESALSPCSIPIFTISRNSPGEITPPFTINRVNSMFFQFFSLQFFSLSLSLSLSGGLKTEN
ncbi:hypothetical protein D3C80_920790 [compost metagenome]